MAGMPFPTRAEIVQGQECQLLELLPAILASNPFYAAKHGAAGSPAIASLDEFRARCPFTTKAELSEDHRAHPPYGSNLTFPLERYSRCHQTSGTTSTPLRWLDTPESWQWMLQQWMEIFRTAYVGPGDRILFAFSFGPFLGFWLAFEAAQRIGSFVLAGGGWTTHNRLAAIKDHRITAVCCTPTYALRLTEVARQEGFDFASSNVKIFLVAGEPGGSVPAIRHVLESAWPGARVFDHHGMTETGPVTHQCPARPGVLHVMEPAYLAEVVAPDTGQPVAAGSLGELVLTTSGRMGSPLLRYRTGDIVRPLDASTPCACGRSTLALEGGILGRCDDMIIVRGVNIFPSAVEDVIRRFPDVAEFQVRVQSASVMTEIDVVIEPAPDVPRPLDLAARLSHALQDAFSLRFNLSLVSPGALPRFEMKSRRWVRP